MVSTSNCCYCFSLRTGTLIIGWLQVVFGVFLYGAEDLIATASPDQGGHNTTSDGLSPRLLVICSLVVVVVGVILLYGVYANEKQYIYWYVGFQVVIYVSSFILDLIFIVTSPDFTHLKPWGMGIPTIMWLIQAYLLIVVHSFCKEMENHA